MKIAHYWDKYVRRGNFVVDCFLGALIAAIVVTIVCVAYLKLCVGNEVPVPTDESTFRHVYAHITVIIAAVAMLFGFLSVYVALRVNETVHVHSLNVRYGGDEMLVTIRLVSDVGRRWKAYFSAPHAAGAFVAPYVFTRSEDHNPRARLDIRNSSAFLKGNKRYMPWSEDEDRARRKLKNHFSQALELYRSRRIGKTAFRSICDNDALRLLFEVVEPMEAIMNENYHFDVFYEILKAMKGECRRLRTITQAHDTKRYYWDDVSKANVKPSKRTWIEKPSPEDELVSGSGDSETTDTTNAK